MFKLLPQMYDWFMQSRIMRPYDEMRSIQSEMESEGQGYDADTINAKLEELSNRANRLSTVSPDRLRKQFIHAAKSYEFCAQSCGIERR